MRWEDQYEEQRRWCDLVHEEPGQDVFENLQLVFMENEVDLLCAAPVELISIHIRKSH